MGYVSLILSFTSDLPGFGILYAEIWGYKASEVGLRIENDILGLDLLRMDMLDEIVYFCIGFFDGECWQMWFMLEMCNICVRYA